MIAEESMKNVSQKLTCLALWLLLGPGLVVVSGQNQNRGSQRQPQASPSLRNQGQTSSRSGSNQDSTKETFTTRLKLATPALEFLIVKDKPLQSKQIKIEDEFEGNKWSFIRLKPWDKTVQVKVASAEPERQTLEKDQLVPAEVWVGFRKAITLEIVPPTDGNDDQLVLVIEGGAAKLPDATLKSSKDAIANKSIVPGGDTQQLTISWRHEAPQTDSWDPLAKTLLWLVVIAVGVVGLAVLIPLLRGKFSFRAWLRGDDFENHEDHYDRNRRRRKESTHIAPDADQLKSGLVPLIKEEFRAEVNRLVQESWKYANEKHLDVRERLDRVETAVSNFKSEVSTPIRQIGDDARRANETANAGLNQVRDQIKSVEMTFTDLREALEERATELRERQRRYNEARQEAVEARVEQARHIETQIRELREQLDRPIERQLTHAQMLGEVLGQNLGAIGDHTLRQLGEAVNEFFQHRVPPADEKLLQLKDRGQEIGASVEALLSKARQVNGSVDSDLGKHVERVRQILSELNAFYSQLTDRQVDLFITGLRIPTAIHAGARDSFLDELGAALKREIEKLRQPAAYFERQFRQLATSEIVAITDICDKKISQSPGSNSDFESDLQMLFKHTGLESILPRAGDDFQSSSQDLVEVVSALEPGLNRKVARVISRGFSYEEDSRKDLLRKAAVVIYG